MSSSDIALPVVAVVAVGIIVVLLAVITVLIVLLRKKTETKNALDPLPHPMGRAGKELHIHFDHSKHENQWLLCIVCSRRGCMVYLTVSAVLFSLLSGCH